MIRSQAVVIPMSWNNQVRSKKSGVYWKMMKIDGNNSRREVNKPNRLPENSHHWFPYQPLVMKEKNGKKTDWCKKTFLSANYFDFILLLHIILLDKERIQWLVSITISIRHYSSSTRHLNLDLIPFLFAFVFDTNSVLIWLLCWATAP